MSADVGDGVGAAVGDVGERVGMLAICAESRVH